MSLCHCTANNLSQGPTALTMQSKLPFGQPRSCMIWFLPIFLTGCISPLHSPHSSYTGFLIPKTSRPSLPLGFCICCSFCLECFTPAFHMVGSLSSGVSSMSSPHTEPSLSILPPGPSYSHHLVYLLKGLPVMILCVVYCFFLQLEC